jgi:hypothetical protein
MVLFGISNYYIFMALGLVALILVGLLVITTLLSLVFILIFLKTRKIIVPRVTLLFLGIVEAPLRQLFWLLGVEDNLLPKTIVEIRNRVYLENYCAVPHEQRMIFVPQCLRHPQCPAPLTPEGLKCIGCGKCGLYRIKEEAEKLGCKFYIAPGSTLIKRMVKKYKPKAVVGVGCLLEVKEGTSEMAARGLPVQGVFLDRDGCVDTRVNVMRLLQVIKMATPDYDITEDLVFSQISDEIGVLWGPAHKKDEVVVIQTK